MSVIDLDDPREWPTSLTQFLDGRLASLHGWKTGKTSRPDWDRALADLSYELQPYSLLGWHCSRLTDAEIDDILHNGMGLPDGTMLERRVDAVVQDGLLNASVAEVLKSRNDADDRFRARKVWFCFFPPRRAEENGIGRFFRHWGGEALYRQHEKDPALSPILADIGTPCLVKAVVPISSLSSKHFGPESAIVKRFLIYRELLPSEAVDYEGYVEKPLSADCLRRILRFPCEAFLDLTGCKEWENPL